jgi:purine-binding chemotaxis protein CheW
MKTNMKTEVVKLVTFRLGQELFAADIFSVERVLRYAPPNSVPDAPAWVEGVLEHRGAVIPVVDMRRRIALPELAITPATRILVLTTADGFVGAIVDAVLEVVAVPVANMSPPPPLFRGLAAEFLRGVAKVRDRLIVVLEMERVLTSADRLTFEAAVDAGRVVAAARG